MNKQKRSMPDKHAVTYLSYALTDPGVLVHNKADFEGCSESMQIIANAIDQLFAEDRPVNEQSVFEVISSKMNSEEQELERWIAGELRTLTMIPFSEKAAKDAAKQLKVYAEEARFINTLDESVKIAASTKGTLEQRKEQVENLIFAGTSNEDRKTFFNNTEAVANTLAQIKRVRDGGEFGVKTGYRALDEVIGGLYPGEVTTVSGGTGGGKTSFQLGVSQHVAANYGPVLNFSIEMTEINVNERMLSSAVRVPVKDLRAGIEPKCGWNEFEKLAHQHAKLPIFWETETSLTPERVRKTLINFIRKYGKKPALIIIDHFHLMQMERNSEDQNNNAKRISAMLAAITKEFLVPVMVLAQLRKTPSGAEAQKPGVFDIRDSAALSNDSSCILFVHWEYRSNKNANPNKIEILVRKSRYGASEVEVPLGFYWGAITNDVPGEKQPFEGPYEAPQQNASKTLTW